MLCLDMTDHGTVVSASAAFDETGIAMPSVSNSAGRWLRQALLMGAVACAAAFTTAVPAQAETIGLAQTSGMNCGGDTTWVDTASSAPRDGAITSFSFASVSNNRNQQLTFKVFRPLGSNVYTVVGSSGTVSLQGTGRETFNLASPIAVRSGDKIGYYHASQLYACASGSYAGGNTARFRFGSGHPQEGGTLTLAGCCYGRVNVEAEFVTDRDNDGVLDTTDNCPTVSNADQADLDNDGQGDLCDEDIDGDGATNADDWAPRDAGEQKDTDGDGVGDHADAFPADPAEQVDTDNDGVGDHGDNCISDANVDQADLDDDATGDACDSDIDGDGTANSADAFPRDPAEQDDTDGDGIGDHADRFPNDATETADADDDGVGDRADNCTTDPNTNQADLDNDGRGDACDADIDGDGIPNTTDNAPRDANADQQDLDGDGIGDVIDPKVLPRTADACKKDGWKRYYDGAARFKNQGDCVSFVATGGKNLPAGS